MDQATQQMMERLSRHMRNSMLAFFLIETSFEPEFLRAATGDSGFHFAVRPKSDSPVLAVDVRLRNDI